jgi:peptidoglycan/LPS O-acetylase OafA/YrhL
VGRPPPARLRGDGGLSEPVKQARELRNARLESLRAIGALSVLCAHSLITATLTLTPEDNPQNRVLLAGGELIFLFFVLSGCLLYTPFARTLGPGGEGRRVDLKRYFLNRALRMLPLYYVTVVVLYFWQPLGAQPEDWWRYATFTQFFDEQSAGRLNGVLWTLVIEMQFYLLLPVFAFLVAKVSRGSLRRAAIVIGVIGVASLVLRLDRRALDHVDATDPFGLNSLPAMFMFLAGGMGLALLRRHLEVTGRRLPGTSGDWLLASLALWTPAIMIRDIDPLSWCAAVVTVGACMLPLQGEGGFLTKVLDWRPLTMVGVVSYSLYLWHGPVILELAGRPEDVTHKDFLPLLGKGLVAALVVAFVSYNVIERPFLKLRGRWLQPATPKGGADGRAAAGDDQAEAVPATALDANPEAATLRDPAADAPVAVEQLEARPLGEPERHANGAPEHGRREAELAQEVAAGDALEARQGAEAPAGAPEGEAPHVRPAEDPARP